MARISLTNPTGRNTNARLVSIGPHGFFFSYETCIAYRGPKVHCRIDNYWGPTTGKHFREMGVYNWDIVDRDLFESALAEFGEPGFDAAIAMLTYVDLG